MPTNWPPPEILEASKRWDADYIRELPKRLDELDTDLIFKDGLVFLAGRQENARSAVSNLRASIEELLFDERRRQNKPAKKTLEEKQSDARAAVRQQEESFLHPPDHKSGYNQS